jgi:hypothetical protein
VKSKNYLKLQAQLKEDQERVDVLTDFITKFEQNNKGCEAVTLRTVRASYEKKIRITQAELDDAPDREVMGVSVGNRLR